MSKMNISNNLKKSISIVIALILIIPLGLSIAYSGGPRGQLGIITLPILFFAVPLGIVIVYGVTSYLITTFSQQPVANQTTSIPESSPPNEKISKVSLKVLVKDLFFNSSGVIVGLLMFAFLLLAFSGFPFFLGQPSSSTIDGLLINAIFRSLLAFAIPMMILIIVLGVLFESRYPNFRQKLYKFWVIGGSIIVLVTYSLTSLPHVFGDINRLLQEREPYIRLLSEYPNSQNVRFLYRPPPVVSDVPSTIIVVYKTTDQPELLLKIYKEIIGQKLLIKTARFEFVSPYADVATRYKKIQISSCDDRYLVSFEISWDSEKAGLNSALVKGNVNRYNFGCDTSKQK